VDVIEFEGGIAHGSVLSDREWYISRLRAIALRDSVRVRTFEPGGEGTAMLDQAMTDLCNR
jgi:hypothetical protein